ncbi:MAG: hypothetical protein KF773_37180 [Deltaproteobacteria bacterium]|nr:hypothetical protein [Deltaproteobacteria bacterium]
MPWKIVEKRVGRAGGAKQREARQRQWDRKHGEDAWAIGYLVDDAFVLQEQALVDVYHRSYDMHFAHHPDDLEELLATAKVLRNPHAEATTGVDLQVPAILDHLKRHDLALRGTDVVDIGSWEGRASHAISIRLSPLTIRCCLDDRVSLETWWQDEKCLAVWTDD